MKVTQRQQYQRDATVVISTCVALLVGYMALGLIDQLARGYIRSEIAFVQADEARKKTEEDSRIMVGTTTWSDATRLYPTPK